jgi:hypothetical protein
MKGQGQNGKNDNMFASPEAIRGLYSDGLNNGQSTRITVPIHKIIHIRSKTVYKYRRNKLKVWLTALIILLKPFLRKFAAFLPRLRLSRPPKLSASFLGWE